MSKKLRRDRHTVSLLTDHMVFSPKYRGKVLVGDVAMIAEGVIRKICVELDIQIIDMAINPDHVHIFMKYPPKYSVSYISKMIKGISSRVLRKEFPHEGMVWRSFMGSKLLPWLGGSRLGSC